MIIDYVGVKEINGSLIVMDGVKGVSNEEIVDIRLDNGTMRQGRVVQIEGERIVVQVFEGTRRISLKNTRTRLTGHPMEMPLSPEIIGRVLDGAGKPIDGLGDIFPVKKANINGTPMNPVSRVYPKNYINTGISTIDTLMTLIRGQKLPIFSGSGMKHNDLAVQIVRQAKISVFALISAVAEFVAGIIGVINAKLPHKANTCIVWGVVVAVMCIAGEIISMIGGSQFNVFSLICGLAIPVLYIIGAVKNKA